MFRFGALSLEDPHCMRLADILRVMRESKKPPKICQCHVSREQVIALIAAAHKLKKTAGTIDRARAGGAL
jgi:hypothetical protein